VIENWKAVVGFEGQYEVSDLGRVRSLDRIVHCSIGKGKTPDRTAPRWLRGRILRPGIASHGYPTVSISGKSHCVNVLVLTAFEGPAPEGAECCHRNGTRTNSRLDNLRWGTRRSNVQDMAIHGTKTLGTRFSSAKLTDETAREVRRLKGVHSQAELADMFGVSPAAIQAVHDGRTWKHA
jgi:hypothetical protein